MNYKIELSNQEHDILPVVMSELRACKRSNPVRSDVVVKRINTRPRKKNFETRISDVRLRKFCNFIRTHSMLPVVASSKGYYTTYSKEEIARQICSLEDRGRSIIQSAKGLHKFLKK